MRALAYPGLVGEPQPGDRVSLNVSALVRGLGTGGYAMVVALPDRLPPDPPPGPGHVVKARYTPLQPMVLGVDEQESPWHERLRDADDVAGMPVVVADLSGKQDDVAQALGGDAVGYQLDVADEAAVKQWRKAEADRASVPAFVVFTDATLMAMAEAKPANDSELIALPGIGSTKVSRYGHACLGIIREHKD